MPEKPVMTREALLNGDIDRLLHSHSNYQTKMSDEQRAELVRSTIESLGEDPEFWIFGYGSLIWNPTIEFEEQRRCTIAGYQRKFCFRTTLSRGTEERPGLMMGLLEGGQCNGVAYRIGLDKVATELDILFRREMAFFVYKPTWVDTRCVETDTTFKSLTFVVDKRSERYVENLEQAETVSTLATAEGPIGRNCDYLYQLSEKLHELDLEDPEMDELVQLVSEYQSRSPGA